jgi:hypothetical protein
LISISWKEAGIEKAPLAEVHAKGAFHPGARPYLMPTRGWGAVVDAARAPFRGGGSFCPLPSRADILDRPGRREAAVGHGSAAINVAVISIIHRVHSSGHRNCGGHIHAAFYYSGSVSWNLV